MQNKAEFIRHATMHIGAGDWQGSCVQAVEYAERLYKALADKGYGFLEVAQAERIACPNCHGIGKSQCRVCNGQGTIKGLPRKP